MSFEARDHKVFELFTRSRYFIPRNQRRYVWTIRNWQELFDDIILTTNGGEPTHFIGSIVLYSEKERQNGLSHYVIIDGQQRITTLTIFLTSIAFWLKCYNAEDEFNGTKQYLLARDDSDKDHIIVTSENHMLLSKILDDVIHFPIEIIKCHSTDSFINLLATGSKDRNVVTAFQFFIKKIGEAVNNSEKDPVDFLVELRDSIVNKVIYVSIIASSEEDACTVFEILNARGSALQDHELLKNYIMRGIKPDGNIDQAKSIWNGMENDLGLNIAKYVKHYATHRYRINSQNNSNDYKIIQLANKGLPTQELLNDLQIKASYYYRLINPIGEGENSNCTRVEYMVYSFLKRKRHEQIRPVLLSLIHQKEIGAISVEKYEKTLLFLYDFIVCYNIIGQENSNKITNIVYSKASELENNYSDDLLQNFIDDLRGKLPGKDNFVSFFSMVGWSHHGGYYESSNEKERVKIVLEVYERHKSLSKSCGEFTIEHIIDDSSNEENSRIGNLIPLEDRLNRMCKGKSFKEKLDIYAKSSFCTARMFASRYKEKALDISQRTSVMAKEFYDEVFDFNLNLELKQVKNSILKNNSVKDSISDLTVGDIVENKRKGAKMEKEISNLQFTLFDYMQDTSENNKD